MDLQQFSARTLIWWSFVCWLCLTPIGPTHAGQSFFGLDLSYTETTFEPQYTFTYDRPPVGYKNIAYGTDLDLLGGYRFQLAPLFSVGVGGSLGISTAEWSTDTTDPIAHLEYRLPYRLFATVQPAVHLLNRFRLFGELGIGSGYIEEKKDSFLRSRYDESRWLWGYRLGAGIGYEFMRDTEISVAYRYTGYEDFSYQTHLPDGTHWETVTDEPYSNQVVMSLIRKW